MTTQISNLRTPNYFETLQNKQIEKTSFSSSIYIELLKFQSQPAKAQFTDYSKLSPVESTQKLSTSSKIFEQNVLLMTGDCNILDCEVADVEPIREIFDNEGKVVQLVSSDGSINYKLIYNGNITTIVNQINGDIHIQELDNKGRLIREVFPCGLEVKFCFEGEYLSEVNLPDQSKVVYQYIDQNHVLIQKVTAEGLVKYQHAYSQENEFMDEEILIGDCGVLQRFYDENTNVLTTNSETLKIIDQFDEERNLLSRTFQNNSADYLSTTIEYPLGDLLVNEHRQLDDQNRVVNYNGYICSYDHEGRLIQKISEEHSYSYNYDALNRLVKVVVDGKIIDYTYDIIGRRISKTVTASGETDKEYYLYQGVNQIGVYNELNNPIYLRTLGIHYNEHLPLAVAIESNDQIYAPIFNSNLNIVQIVNIATKEVADYQNLSSFGDNLQDMSLICPWIFATKYFDADTGLVDFGNRQYDPTIKQWTTKDSDPRATLEDFYAYCNNNPLKYIDPDGKFAFIVFIPLTLGWKAVAIALGIGAVTAGAKVAADRGAKNINNKDLALAVGGIGGYLAAAAVNKVINMPFPDRDLPRDEKTDEPLPDTDCPHTQLGWRNGKYPQAREFDENGRPIKDIDFTDHDRPQNHPCPHQHPYNENDTGGTKQRGKIAEVVPGWNYSNE